jgi:DNA-binding CsgD family transcriptional regulator
LVGGNREFNVSANGFFAFSQMAHSNPNLGLRSHHMQEDPSQPGLLMLDESFKLIGYNSEAVQILSFPSRSEDLRYLQSLVDNKIVSAHCRNRQTKDDVAAWEIRSGKRTYLGHTLPLTSRCHSRGYEPALLLLLDRRPFRSVNMSEVARRFGLTEREQESVALLVQGLTSKEIASRMKISPNTVKAFVHLAMVKTGVNTRSGIVGKLFIPGVTPARRGNPQSFIAAGRKSLSHGPQFPIRNNSISVQAGERTENILRKNRLLSAE